ncbi:hypothetical protein EYV94_24325 [Puteibacter caeruleilacunae]|nr:hypothetical protein EYV94_24325 [Puteibacter caeruleilacunae]
MALLCLNSCNTDEFDLDKLSDKVNWQPDVMVPVMKSDWRLFDLVNQDSTIFRVDEENLIRVIYREDSLVNIVVNDLFEVQDGQELMNESLDFDVLKIPDIHKADIIALTEFLKNIGGVYSTLDLDHKTTVTLPDYATSGNLGEYDLSIADLLEKATFAKGILKIDITNNTPVAMQPLFDLIFDGEDREQLDFGMIEPQQTITKEYDLSGRTVNSTLKFRLVKFSTPGSKKAVAVDGNTAVKLGVTISGGRITAGILNVTEDSKLKKSKNATVKLDDQIKLQRLKLKSGTMDYSVYSEFKNDVIVRFILPSAKVGDKVFYKDVFVGSKAKAEGTWDISDVDIDLGTVANKPYNKLPISYEVTIADGSNKFIFDSSEKVRLSLLLNEPKIEYAQGNFGKQQIKIKRDEIDIDMDFWDDIKGDFKIQNPELRFKIKSSAGVPGLLKLNLEASNKEGEVQKLNAQPQMVPYPVDLRESPLIGEVVYDNSNSDIVRIVSLPPSGKVEYDGILEINPEDNDDMNNFMSHESAILVDFEIDMPLVIQTNNLGVDERIGLTGSEFEKVTKAELVINYENEIPMDVEVKIGLLGEEDVVLEEISPDVLPAATVDKQGNAAGSTVGSIRIELTDDQLIKLKNSEAIGLVVRIKSAKGGDIPVRLLADYLLKLNVVVEASLDFTN